jgi:pyruvate carboxylase subunit B
MYDGNPTNIRIDGRDVQVDFRRLHSGKLFSLLADNIAHEFAIERADGGFDIWHSAGQFRVEVSDEKTERLRKLMGEAGGGVKAGSLKAPMPGLVVRVEVEVGQHINKGDGLLIVEAMKMENELKAHAPCVIKEIKVKPGQPVEKNQVLIVFG